MSWTSTVRNVKSWSFHDDQTSLGKELVNHVPSPYEMTHEKSDLNGKPAKRQTIVKQSPNARLTSNANHVLIAVGDENAQTSVLQQRQEFISFFIWMAGSSVVERPDRGLQFWA